MLVVLVESPKLKSNAVWDEASPTTWLLLNSACTVPLQLSREAMSPVEERVMSFDLKASLSFAVSPPVSVVILMSVPLVSRTILSENVDEKLPDVPTSKRMPCPDVVEFSSK